MINLIFYLCFNISLNNAKTTNHLKNCFNARYVLLVQICLILYLIALTFLHISVSNNKLLIKVCPFLKSLLKVLSKKLYNISLYLQRTLISEQKWKGYIFLGTLCIKCRKLCIEMCNTLRIWNRVLSYFIVLYCNSNNGKYFVI